MSGREVQKSQKIQILKRLLRKTFSETMISLNGAGVNGGVKFFEELSDMFFHGG